MHRKLSVRQQTLQLAVTSMQQRSRIREAYIKYEHANRKCGLDDLYQEVDADRIEAEVALRILAQVHQHRLQTCNMQRPICENIDAAGLHTTNTHNVQGAVKSLLNVQQMYGAG